MNKADKQFTLDEFVEYVTLNFPDHALVKISDYESSDKETYKFLYEKKCSELKECQEELFMARSDIQHLERDYADLSASLKNEKNINKNLNTESKTFIDFINQYLRKDVCVSDVTAYNSDGNKIESTAYHISDPDLLSDKPGVYGFKRPSWFSPLQKELSRKNITEKNLEHTKGFLLSRLLFMKKILSSDALKKAADEVDSERKRNIAKILLGPGSNEEKYLKYILSTPGISKEFRNILFTAADLGLDANVVIELLEQPEESFNKEIIEAFISELHKGTEYNLKQELADELVRGDWYISASVNGSNQKLQLVPIDEIRDIENKLETISKSLSHKDNSEKTGSDESAIVPDLTGQEIHDEERFPFIYEDENEMPESSGMVNFDDSMI